MSVLISSSLDLEVAAAFQLGLAREKNYIFFLI